VSTSDWLQKINDYKKQVESGEITPVLAEPVKSPETIKPAEPVRSQCEQPKPRNVATEHIEPPPPVRAFFPYMGIDDRIARREARNIGAYMREFEKPQPPPVNPYSGLKPSDTFARMIEITDEAGKKLDFNRLLC